MNQLTQLFSDKDEAELARDQAIFEHGRKNVNYFVGGTVRIDDKRNDATTPKSYRRFGNPMYVVQVSFD